MTNKELETIFQSLLDDKEMFVKETKLPVKTIDDGINYLSSWEIILSTVVNEILDNVLGDCTEEILNEDALQEASSHGASKDHKNNLNDMADKINKLSEDILLFSDSIDNIIYALENNRELKQDRHKFFIFRINSGIHTMKTVQDMINFPKFDDLKDTLTGLEKNFRKFYNAYKTVLNIVDSNETLQRPENY